MDDQESDDAAHGAAAERPPRSGRVPREAIISRQQRLQQAAMPRGGGVGDFDPRGFYVYQAGHVFHHAARG